MTYICILSLIDEYIYLKWAQCNLHLLKRKWKRCGKIPLGSPMIIFQLFWLIWKEKKWKNHLTTSVSEKAAIQKDSAAHQKDELSSSDEYLHIFRRTLDILKSQNWRKWWQSHTLLPIIHLCLCLMFSCPYRKKYKSHAIYMTNPCPVSNTHINAHEP